MHIIAVDDELPSLNLIGELLGEVEPNCALELFSKPREALEFAKYNDVDIAFLDISMRGMNGIELAQQLKFARPNINVIFTTGYDEYMKEAFALHASGYLLKPITAEKIAAELKDLRNPVAPEERENRLYIRCFGNFEVFVNREPLKFKYAKSKEFFAYLVDRLGAMVTLREMNAVLWESGNHDSYLRDLRKDLVDTFAQAGCPDVLRIERGRICVVVDNVVCDYFDFKSGRASGINAYNGEYMSQYSWGELTKGYLE